MMQSNYKTSFGISSVAHVLLFLFLFTDLTLNSSLTYVTKSGHAPQLVQAVTVNQQQVQQEVEHLKQEQAAKQANEIKRVRHLQNLANQASMTRRRELNAVEKLKVHQQEIMKQQKQSEAQALQRLDQLKQQQIAREQNIANLEKQQQAASANFKTQQSKLAALQKQQIQMEQQNQVSQASKQLIQQQLQQAQSQLDAAKKTYIQGVVNKYNALVLQAIYQNWIIPPNADPKDHLKLQVTVAKTGAVTNVVILQSSGDSALDQSASLAVYKASPLPIPMNNPVVWQQFQQFSLTMTPSETTS